MCVGGWRWVEVGRWVEGGGGWVEVGGGGCTA